MEIYEAVFETIDHIKANQLFANEEIAKDYCYKHARDYHRISLIPYVEKDGFFCKRTPILKLGDYYEQI